MEKLVFVPHLITLQSQMKRWRLRWGRWLKCCQRASDVDINVQWRRCFEVFLSLADLAIPEVFRKPVFLASKIKHIIINLGVGITLTPNSISLEY